MNDTIRKELGVRFYKRQKTKFTNMMSNEFQELGYASFIDSKREKLTKVNNLMIGNFKTASNIIVVPYDTPARIFWPNYKYFVQDGTKTMKKNFLPTYTPMILGYLLLLFVVYILPTAIDIKFQFVLFSFAILYLGLLLIFIVKGFPNKNNDVRNNASILLAYEIASNLSSNKRKETAFVFSDSNTIKMYGSKVLEAYLTSIKKSPTKIVLYCLGRGDTISIGYKKGTRKNTNTLIKAYKGSYKLKSSSMDMNDCLQLPIEYLENTLQISSGNIVDETLVVENTCGNKDVEYDEQLLEDVKEMVISYLK